jgi:hypothetical protein
LRLIIVCMKSKRFFPSFIDALLFSDHYDREISGYLGNVGLLVSGGTPSHAGVPKIKPSDLAREAAVDADNRESWSGDDWWPNLTDALLAAGFAAIGTAALGAAAAEARLTLHPGETLNDIPLNYNGFSVETSQFADPTFCDAGNTSLVALRHMESANGSRPYSACIACRRPVSRQRRSTVRGGVRSRAKSQSDSSKNPGNVSAACSITCPQTVERRDAAASFRSVRRYSISRRNCSGECNP